MKKRATQNAVIEKAVLSWPSATREAAIPILESGRPRSGKTQYATSRSFSNALPRRVLEIALVFVAYFLTGKIGLAVPFTNGNVSPVWPAAGIALAALLAFGYRVWPAIAAGAFLVNFFSPIPHTAALGIALGNAAGPLASAWLLRRISGFRPCLTDLRDVLGLIAFGALGGTAISATIGTWTLFAAHVRPWSNFGISWLMWWCGDAMGVLLATPLAMTFPRLFAMCRNRRWLEMAGLLLGALFTCYLLFEGRPQNHAGQDVLAYGVFPFVIWGAIRFEAAGAAAISGLVSAVAVWETAHGFGPFIRNNVLQNVALLQSYLTAISATGLILAAVVTERAELIRRQTEREALRKGEERYREIAETANEGIWMLDSQWLTCFVNRRMSEMLGYNAAEMIGAPLFNFVFEEDIEQRRADLKRRQAGMNEQVERRYRKKDGSELWARVSSSGSFSADGKFAGALAMVSDIGDQMRRDAERREALERVMLLSRALEQTADSVVVTNKRGIIEYVNPAFESTTGYTREEVLGKTPRILKSGRHDPSFYQALWNSILEGRAFRGTLVNQKKCGDLYWTEQTITPIKDDVGRITHFVSVLKDISDLRKKQEQEVYLRLAQEVQQRLYATGISVPGFDVAAAAFPARETGGDYFDFIQMNEGDFYIAIGDASGHGFGSAIVMALTRAYVRSFAAMKLDVGDILTRVNRMLAADLEDNRFVTLLLVRIDPIERSLTYTSAGHVPGYLLNGEGEVEYLLASMGPPLGIFEHSSFPSATISLDPQQLIFLATDGAAETAAPDGGQFGTDRVLEYLRAHRRDSARSIVEGVYKSARAFAKDTPQDDDIASVVVKVGDI